MAEEVITQVTPSQVVGYKHVQKFTVNDNINSTLSLNLPSSNDGNSSRDKFGINSPREIPIIP
jgi:hypothetical protein